MNKILFALKKERREVSVSNRRLQIVCSVVTGVLASHVGDEENDSEHDAESANNDVANCQEIVCAAENVRSGEHEVLVARKGAHVVLVPDFQNITSLLEVAFDLAIKFAEVWKTCCAHPHNEVF